MPPRGFNTHLEGVDFLRVLKHYMSLNRYLQFISVLSRKVRYHQIGGVV